VTGAEDVDAWVRDALLTPVFDKLSTEEHVELARGFFQSAEAAFEMTHIRRAIREADCVADVLVFFVGA
jgi:hypothetical protein